MKTQYSVHETQSRFSAEQTLEERLMDLERRGVLIPARSSTSNVGLVARRPGALARFLAERHDGTEGDVAQSATVSNSQQFHDQSDQIPKEHP